MYGLFNFGAASEAVMTCFPFLKKYQYEKLRREGEDLASELLNTIGNKNYGTNKKTIELTSELPAALIYQLLLDFTLRISPSNFTELKKSRLTFIRQLKQELDNNEHDALRMELNNIIAINNKSIADAEEDLYGYLDNESLSFFRKTVTKATSSGLKLKINDIIENLKQDAYFRPDAEIEKSDIASTPG